MSHPRYEDWKLLDLEPGAELTDVNRALRFRRSLYQRDALATYNLLDEDERMRMLDRIDEAYRRITGNEPPPTHPTRRLAEEDDIELLEKPAGPPPDPRTEPGAFLAHHRRVQGLSIERLAAETKIRVTLLQQLENESTDKLPEAVFVRGHVLTYARALGLDNPNEIAARYLAKVKLD